MSTKAGGSDHLLLFTYGNHLLITCAFRFNIYYLFIYLFKVMSTKAGKSDHLFLFTYANHLLWDRVFVLIFSIYLFIYFFIESDVNITRWKWRPLLLPAMKLGQGYIFTSSISGSHQNTYGWQAGSTHPTAMLSYLLIKIGCCDLFLDIFFLKSIFRNILHLELFLEEHWDNVVKYRHVNKKEK